jgi:hypothetical protein
MRKAFTVLSALLLATTLSFAADDDDKRDKVSGCLMQMGEDFIITDANGVKYEIDGMNKELKANLGRVVEISGELEGRSQDEKHHAIKIDAKELKVLAGECSATGMMKARPEGEAAALGAASAAPQASGQVTQQTTAPSTSGTVAQQTTTTTTTTTKAPEGSTVTTTQPQTSTQTQTMPSAPSASAQGGVTAAPTAPTTPAPAARPEGDVYPSSKTGAETDTGKHTITGCVSRSGDHFVLTEQATGTTYRLDGEGDKLPAHIGHTVTLTGDAERLNEVSSSGAQMEFDVKDIQHVSDNCSAAPKQ